MSDASVDKQPMTHSSPFPKADRFITEAVNFAAIGFSVGAIALGVAASFTKPRAYLPQMMQNLSPGKTLLAGVGAWIISNALTGTIERAYDQGSTKELQQHFGELKAALDAKAAAEKSPGQSVG